ncbi:zinc finger BED domain-containing protein 5-like [Palaemon carinicauda]|uniref:zinc finger BED domain-containing protein 5-like n=1 Tax=Palaemon carinicauda TaxID=392227 RepID=UPI0035B61BB2
MLGLKSGFQSRVKKLAPQAMGIHCMIHRYALASKTLPAILQEVLESVIKIVNYIKTKALNTRLFKELCKDMNADHEVLLFYTAVLWLSKGNVINSVFENEDETKLFLETQERKDLVVHFKDKAWNKRVAYLADIFDQLNKLNLKLQGRETHVLLFQDSLRAFVSKLQNWRRKTNLGNIAMFEKLCGVMDESHIQLDQFLKDEITEHLQSLEKEVERYFPELSQEQEALVRNPFCTELDISSIPDEIQDEYLNLRNDSSARDLFKVKSVTQFWCGMYQSYSKISMIALRVLVPFASTYLCEAGFSTLVNMKTKNRNRLELDVGDDMRLALTTFRPRISKLAAEMQHQASH